MTLCMEGREGGGGECEKEREQGRQVKLCETSLEKGGRDYFSHNNILKGQCHKSSFRLLFKGTVSRE